jgi:hypothetical protein
MIKVRCAIYTRAMGRGEGAAATAAGRCVADRRARGRQGRSGCRMKFVTKRPFADLDAAAKAGGDRQCRRGGPRRPHLHRADQYPFLEEDGTPDSSAFPSRARSRWAGCGGMKAGRM